MKHRILTYILILVLLVSTLLTACGRSDRPSASNPVTLTMWHNYGGDMQQTMDALIDEFNSTIGKEEGIIINVTAISSSSELNESLKMIVNGDPGAPVMPDICTAYPNVAINFQKKGMLANLNHYFSDKELSAYLPAFIDEGRIDDGLYVFPIAKSTEIIFLNQTLFDEFSAATGASMEKMKTMEGIAELAQSYYQWTDSLTPAITGDGKAFYAADSWFNLAEVGMAQFGTSIFDEQNQLSLDNASFRHILETVYTPSVYGGYAIYDGYSSDLSKTGDLVCSTGSSAGVLFYGSTITYDDGTVKDVEYSILPYPVFEGQKSIALQRGGGLMVAANEKKKEYAASLFVKWLTSPQQNMRFVASTGYLPVTKQAFEEDMQKQIETMEDVRIQKMLVAVTSMYENYEFFTAPVFTEFDSISKSYIKNFKELMNQHRKDYLSGKTVSFSDTLTDTLE